MTVPRFGLPRSLFGRNLLLIIALILLAEIGNGVVFRQVVQEPRAAHMAEVAKLQIETVRAALQLAPSEQREALLNRLASQNLAGDKTAIAVSRVTKSAERPAELSEPRHVAIAIFIQRLRQQLGRQYTVAWEEQPEQRLWIATRIDDANYWVGVDASVFVGSTTTLFAVISIGAGLLAVLGAMLIQRRINRPLNALAVAATKIGRGAIETLPLENLPTEIAGVAQSFNRMAGELQAAERERALMLAGVSHDLRTPLAKLRLAVAILAESGEPELIEGMVRNIAAADAIIGQFIDFARLGSEETVQHCDVNEIVSHVAQTVGTPQITLQLGALPAIACRPLSLGRAVTNLVENALRYGKGMGNKPDDAVLIHTTLTGGSIFISVSDHGSGIPVDQMERLRQPFTRFDEARSATIGAGLGLSIVDRIARLHHGELKLTNRAGGGLEAAIILPLQ